MAEVEWKTTGYRSRKPVDAKNSLLIANIILKFEMICLFLK